MNTTIDAVFLKLGQSQYKVLKHSFHIRQSEKNGKPFGHPIVQRFSLKIESDGDDSQLMSWGTDSVKTHDGSIDFMSNGALVSQISFSGAACVGYENEGNYDLMTGNNSIIEDVEIIPTAFSWNDAKYERAA